MACVLIRNNQTVHQFSGMDLKMKPHCRWSGVDIRSPHDRTCVSSIFKCFFHRFPVQCGVNSLYKCTALLFNVQFSVNCSGSNVTQTAKHCSHQSTNFITNFVW